MSSVWFPFYTGDYLRKTSHLSVIENGAYLLLLIYCYATGQPLPTDKAAIYRIARAHKGVERAAVDSALNQFFILQDDGYHNDRAESEQAKQAERKDRLSGSGRKGAQKRWGTNGQAISHPTAHPSDEASGKVTIEGNGLSMANPQSYTQPKKETSKATPAPETGATVELPDWLPKKEWNDYLKMRKRIRREATPEAMKLAIRDLEKLKSAGNDTKLVLEQSILNSWQGLFELRVDFAAARDADRNRDAMAGKHRDAPQRVQTPEEKAAFERQEIEAQRWEGLEKGTLPVTTETVTWVKEKMARLKGARLPAQDPRPRWFKTYLDRAREVAPRQVPA